MPTESPRSTLKFSAQQRSFGLKISENPEATSSVDNKTPVKASAYKLLPKYSSSRKPTKNPFNEKLLDILSRPMCSPDFCVSAPSPAKEQPKEFFWTPEDLWRIDPAPIDSPQTDYEDHLDEETESLAQEAIDKYFQESHNVLSPIGSPLNSVDLRAETPQDTPKCHSDRAMSTPCTRYDSRRVMKCTVSVQTTLSFSTDIPDHILDMMKPYVNNLEECETDVSLMSSTTLRRKLFHELYNSSTDSECEDNLIKIPSRFLPEDWTPDRVKATIELFDKSPDVSPIAEGIVATHSKEVFNFTKDMAIDSATSPIKVDERTSEAHHMSVDFCHESTLESSSQRISSRTSADTGYNTNPSDRSRPSSADRDDKHIRSYLAAVDSSDTGITSTPAKNKLREKIYIKNK